MSDTMFDDDAFHRSLFFPRPDASPVPPGARDVPIDVEGARLHLRIHDADEGRARVTVLFFHGNAEIVADYDDAAQHFLKAGARLAVLDYRGYGQSTGAPTFRAILHDARAVFDALAREVEGPIVVMGRSLGSACAIELFANVPSERLVGVVLESGFSDLDAMVRRRNCDPREISVEDRATFDAIPKLKRGTLPLLVIHGEDDTLIVPNEARVTYAAAGSQKKELVVIAGRGHNDVSRSPLYWQALAIFLSRWR